MDTRLGHEGHCAETSGRRPDLDNSTVPAGGKFPPPPLIPQAFKLFILYLLIAVRKPIVTFDPLAYALRRKRGEDPPIYGIVHASPVLEYDPHALRCTVVSFKPRKWHGAEGAYRKYQYFTSV